MRKESSAEATKGSPVPPIGGLTVLRIPSNKGKAGMLLDLGTSGGVGATHYASFLSLGRGGGRGMGSWGATRLVWEQRRVVGGQLLKGEVVRGRESSGDG